MCGIIGAVNFNLNINKAKAILYHRGPDQQDVLKIDNVHLYHLRLAIIDAEGGRQPMSYLSRYHLIYNGQIYNYKEVNDKFNLELDTNSDTETLIRMYHEHKEGCLAHFDGMFAFAIYDCVEKKVFIARDRAGKKPLYYYLKDGAFIFSSELNAIKGQVSLTPSINNINNYLRLGSFIRNETPYEEINELKAGNHLTLDVGSMQLTKKKWWSISDYYNKPKIISNALEELDELLRTAVKRRMLASDLEVGTFLSGGIDSGLVTAIASELTDNLKTFTVSFEGEYDEAPLARLVSEKYKTDHSEIKISFSNLKNDVESILHNYGEPFYDSSAIPSYYVSQEAKKHVTVVLNGDGADELFGGYRRYVPYAKYNFFKTPKVVNKLSQVAYGMLPYPKNKKNKYNYLHRLLSLASKSNFDQYLSATVDIFEGHTDKFLIPSSSMDGFDIYKFNQLSTNNTSGLDALMCTDFNILLFSDLLVKMDIASMANSLEGRSPFLSKELLEFAPRLDPNLKIKGVNTKYLLRELAKKYLPPKLINQPKRGFEIPLLKWVNNDLKEIINDKLLSSDAFWMLFLDKDWMRKVINNKVKISPEKRAKMLWTLFSLEVWNDNN